ncbi:MAG: Asp-tRNA(Asn)/Glu-tRNA(Gln) amidotransferase subunit GatB [Lachnospiraceae bacterium]|nr:Asp-tRNA(Asn)/Glu-tRNA(Gln) amidotransferase subunit GatB [Lachnospiraceae bacterium]
MSNAYEMVIGVEVHIELSTKTKIFCSCATTFGAKPNTQVCPVCMALPGSLPVLNKKVLEYATAVGIATNCDISSTCRFDRKNYFYPDNPQNYQISQLYVPLCKNGFIDIDTKDGAKAIRIHEIHMEEDAGKLIHEENGKCSVVDFNRAGVPLIEVVSKPDMSNADEVIAFVESLRLIAQYLEVSDCKLQEGSMRVDVNLSVRKKGEEAMGTRTEMKNLNSFRAIKRAIEHESKRQIELLESGKNVLQETRRWDDNVGNSFSMRSKEEAKDYRYFPEPDLPKVCVSKELIMSIKAAQPEFAFTKAKRYKDEYGFSEEDIAIITSTKQMAHFFESTVALSNKPREVANWIIGEMMRNLKDNSMEIEEIKLKPKQLAMLIELIEERKINRGIAKEVFEKAFVEEIDLENYIKSNNLLLVCDEEMLIKVIKEVIKNNPQSVEDYRAGKLKAKGYIVGQTMRMMKGTADPEIVNNKVEELLAAP